MIVMILILINIFFTLYVEKRNYKKYYLPRQPMQYFQKNKITKILPSEPKMLKNELNIFQDYLNHNIDGEYDFEKYYFFNLDNPITSNNKYCFNLLEKLVYCLSEENMKNLKNSKCNKLIENEMEELEKCQIDFNFDFDINDYSQKIDNIENDIFYLNFSTFDKYNKEIEEEELETQDIIIDNEEIGAIIKDKKKMIKADTKENITNEENSKKDCVEYGISNDEFLICTKYE